MRPEGFRRSSANADIRVPVASVLIQAGPRSLTESSGGADSALELSSGAGPPPKRRPLSRGVVGYWGSSRKRLDALFVDPDPFLISRRVQLVHLAALHKVPPGS